MGDPAGIGPEICLDLLANSEMATQCTPIVLGDRAILERCAEATGKPAPQTIISVEEVPHASQPSLLEVPSISLDEFEPGTVNPATGKAGYDYVVKAIDLALAGVVQGVATGPINKEALRSAGIPHPGHTEIFAERTKAERACMMLTSDVLTCSFVTVHVGYHEVPGLLSVERIVEVIELTREAMRRIRGKEPKIVVCGLNPHAGEHGLFGNQEEERIILPAIEEQRAAGTP